MNKLVSRQKKKKIGVLLNAFLMHNDTITRQEALKLVLADDPSVEARHVDEWAADNLQKVGRGVWSLASTQSSKSTPIGEVSKRRKTGPRMPGEERLKLAKAVAGAMFLEIPKPTPSIVTEAARASGITNLPGNVIAAITPDYQREYEALVLEAIMDKPVVVTERFVLDLSQAHPVDLLRELMGRGGEVLKELESLKVNHTIEQHYLPTTTTPKAKDKRYRVLITGLLPSQVADMKNRPKIKANAGRLDLHFLTQDSTTLRIPNTVDLVLSFRKMRHSLWNSLNAHYGREKVHIFEGIHGIEEALMTGLSQWAHA